MVGDGIQEEVTMAGDKLLDEDRLRREARELRQPQCVRDSGKKLGEKVKRFVWTLYLHIHMYTLYILLNPGTICMQKILRRAPLIFVFQGPSWMRKN